MNSLFMLMYLREGRGTVLPLSSSLESVRGNTFFCIFLSSLTHSSQWGDIVVLVRPNIGPYLLVSRV